MASFFSIYIRYNKKQMTENRVGRSRPSLHQPLNQDEGLSYGPIITKYKNRSMTDISCLWFYSILSIIVITSFFCSYILDKDNNIFKPRDPDLRKCGEDDVQAYPYIYFPAPFAESINGSVCVKSCPTSTEDKVDCYPNSVIKSCEFRMTDHFNRSNQFIIYPTKKNSFLSMCQPHSRIIFDAINQKINTHYLFMNLQNLYESMYVIIIVCPAISVLLVAIYVCVITRFTDLTNIFIGFICLFSAILIGFAVYSFLPAGKRVFAFMPYVGIIVLVIALCFIAFMIYYREYVLESLKLLNKGAEYIRSNRSLIFLSLVFFLIWVIIFLLEVIALIFIYSMDTASVNYSDAPQTKPVYTFAYFTGIRNTLFIKILLVLTVFHYIWTNLILYSMGEYICMGAGAFWILNVKHNFKNALYTLLKFHLGTVIYGSLANAFYGKFVGFLYFLMPRKNHRLCCCAMERWSSFYHTSLFKDKLGIYNDLNYIRVALKGETLEVAGANMTTVLVDYLNDVSRAYRVARVVVFISKFLVAFLTTFICYIIMQFSQNMKGTFMTNVLIFIISSFLASFAFESYDRSFQVILITILIKKQQRELQAKRMNDPHHRLPEDHLHQGHESPQELEEDILQWFEKQTKNEMDRSKK